MTNPDNAVGTNAAYGGRTSANAFNDDLAAYSRGIMSGWACAPSSGLTVVLGGDGSTRDVAVAEDNAGNRTTINNISGSSVSVTLEAAPGANSRIDAIVAYVDNPPQGSSTIADNYEACGLIAVSGTASASPVAPNDSAIRSAITADGASGATAYYVVLATVTIASGTTDIVAGDITAGLNAMIQTQNINFGAFPDANYSTTEFNTGKTWVDGKPIYCRVFDTGLVTTSTLQPLRTGLYNIDNVIEAEGYWVNGSNNQKMVFGECLPASATILQATRAFIQPTDNNELNLQYSQVGGTTPSRVRIVAAVYYTKLS